MVIFLPFFVALTAAIIPPILWLFFFTRKDQHPEPAELIVYTFVFGGLMTIPALLLQQIFFKGLGTEYALLSLILFALFEEIFKFFGSFFTVKRAPAFDEPVDAMIYTITAALGFATIENFFNIAGTWEALAALVPAEAFYTATLRFTGATLLHALASALVGYFWARGILAGKQGIFIVFGIVVATAVHSVFNLLISHFQMDANLILPSVFLMLILFLVSVDFEKLRGVKKFPSTH